MPRFSYLARTKEGNVVKSFVDAATEDDAVQKLHQQELLVLKLSSAAGKAKSQAVSRRLRNRITARDLIVMGRSLSVMLEGGFPLVKALETSIKQCESRKLKTVLEAIKEDVSAGKTFHEALSRYPRVFSKFWVALIEAGEAGGKLAQSLMHITSYLEKTEAFKSKIVSAMIYPIILMCVAFAASFIFAFKIIPMFARIFETFDSKLPTITLVVIHISNILRAYVGLIVAGGVFGIYAFRRFLLKIDAVKLRYDKLLLNTPFVGAFIDAVLIQRIASGMGTLLDSGVPILHSIEIVMQSMDNKVFEGLLLEVKESVRQGKPIAQPLEQSLLISPMVVQMIHAGEESGKLSDMFEEIARYYEQQADSLVTRLTSAFEPLMLVVMGVIIGIFVIAMFLPIFNLAFSVK